MNKWNKMSDRKTLENEVKSLIYTIYESKKNKDIQFLNRIYRNKEKFSKYNEYAPLRRLNRDEALLHDELYISNISDYSYEIKNLRIDIHDNIAIATFYIQHNGIFVNNYNFTGKQIQNRTRSTMIFERYKVEWFVIHEHNSILEQ